MLNILSQIIAGQVPSAASIFPLRMRKQPGRPENEPQNPKQTPQPDPKSPGDFPNDQPVQMPGQDRPGTTRPDQEKGSPGPEEEPGPGGPGSKPADMPGNEPDITPEKPGGDRELNFSPGVKLNVRSERRTTKSSSSKGDRKGQRSSVFMSSKRTHTRDSAPRSKKSSEKDRKVVSHRSMVEDTNPQGNSRSPEKNIYDDRRKSR